MSVFLETVGLLAVTRRSSTTDSSIESTSGLVGPPRFDRALKKPLKMNFMFNQNADAPEGERA